MIDYEEDENILRKKETESSRSRSPSPNALGQSDRGSFKQPFKRSRSRSPISMTAEEEKLPVPEIDYRQRFNVPHMGVNANAGVRPLNFERSSSPKPSKQGKSISDYFQTSSSSSSNPKRKKRATPQFQTALDALDDKEEVK